MTRAQDPFDWYWSGQFWYCSVVGADGTKVSGCGKTKPQAVEDGRKQLRKLEQKRVQNRKVEASQRTLGRFVGQFLYERLYGKKAS